LERIEVAATELVEDDPSFSVVAAINALDLNGLELDALGDAELVAVLAGLIHISSTFCEIAYHGADQP